jgi:hypothetical protein
MVFDMARHGLRGINLAWTAGTGGTYVGSQRAVERALQLLCTPQCTLLPDASERSFKHFLLLQRTAQVRE